MKKKIIINGKPSNYSVTDDAKIYNDITGKELKGTYNTNEYHSVQLVIDGLPKTFMFHRLVAEAFCENPNNYTIVDHIDRNKHNDNASNLRWVDSSQNAKNCVRKQALKNKKYLGDFTEKEWRPVLGYKDFMISEDCEVVNTKTKNIMAHKDRNGYKRISLGNEQRSLHILMWESFNDQYVPDGYLIDHIDGDKSNNRLSNLRLATRSENMKNAYANGHNGQVKIKLYDLNGNYIATYNSYTEAGEALNVSREAIRLAADRLGTSNGFYWLKEKDNIDILSLINSWVPEGYRIIKRFPTYCIDREGNVYNKRNKAITPYILWADGKTKSIVLQKVRVRVDDLLKETFPELFIIQENENI